MKTIYIALLFIFAYQITIAQQRTEIKVKDVPKEVIVVLNQYLTILSTSKTLEDCGKNLLPIAGGHILAQSGTAISTDVMQFSLKKDYQNVKFYKIPAVITRVQLITNTYDGYGPTLTEGNIYKIWIAKKDGVNGMPAPIPVLVPKNNPKSPKIVTTIGSL